MKRRSKIVSFRLSDEEYNSLKNVTESRGARSVSEFTRSVACNAEAGGNGAETIKVSLATLNDRVEALVHKIETLTGALEDKNATDYTDMKKKETLP